MRSGRWLPHFSAMMDKHEVPQLLKLLPHVESSFVAHARSNVGAAGMWQFTRGTGRRFMKVNHVIDERLDPYIAAEAAAKLLRFNYDRVQSWPLAITAYNHGLRSVTRAADKFGKDNLVTILRQYDGRRFGFASRNFYLSFVAAVHVHLNYQRYFGDLVIEDYFKPDILKLPKYLSIQALQSIGLDKKSLKPLNPALSSAVWDGDKYLPKNYALRLPSGTVERVMSVDKRYWHVAQTPDLYHKVKRGETLSEIAKRHKVSLRSLKKANNIRNVRRIQIGQRLVLPGRVAKKVEQAVVKKRVAENDIYIVQSGDTLSDIANDFNLNINDIKSWNSIKNVRQLRVNQKLYLKPQTVEAIATISSSSDEKSNTVIPRADDLVKTADVAESDIVHSSTEATSSLKIDDRTDYTVSQKDTILVLPRETIGHYAEWLGTSAQSLRRLNNIRYNQALVTGHNLKLSFDNVSKSHFVKQRQTFHQKIQQEFYKKYKITGQTEYQIKNGDSLWLLAQRDYRVPIWLLKQYNPGIEIEKVNAGATVVFPLVVEQ